MALISKNFTFASGAIIVASQHNSNFDQLFNLVNGTLDTTNISASAGILDTQLATISTAGKVSGTAITSGDIAIASTSTTTTALTITASSLTSGTVASLFSNSADTSVRNLFSITNNNALATGTSLISMTQKSTNTMFSATASCTTGSVFNIQADSLTTGNAGYFASNSASTGSRNLFAILNQNALATSTYALYIEQDSTNPALYINYAGTPSDTLSAIRLDGCTVNNGSATVTISNVAPAGVGTATISKWLPINIGGTMYYVPLWT